MEQKKRETAYKVWIKNLVNGEYIKREGEFEPNFINVNNKKISRVNIIANIISIFNFENNEYSVVVIDDGSANIKVKAWQDDVKLLSTLKIGDIVNIIGKVRKYDDEIYIQPEIARVLDDPNWELVRKLELIKEYGKLEEIKENKKQEEIIIKSNHEEIIVEDISEESRQKILNLIEKLDNGEGANIDDVIKKSKLDEAESVINELLKEGEVFEPRPCKIKIIE